MNCYTEGNNMLVVYDEHSLIWVLEELNPLFEKCGLLFGVNIFQDIEDIDSVKYIFTITDPECFTMLKLQIIK